MLGQYDTGPNLTKFEAKTEDDLWRICDILRQMAYKFVPVGLAVLVDGIREDERLSILYVVRCECVQPTEFDEELYNAL